MHMSTHLHIRTSYSLLESTIRIPSLLHTLKQMGYTQVVISDHNVLSGLPLFLKACKKEGIKGIAGIEIDVDYHEEKIPFLLIAKNRKGYQALMHLSSIVQMEKRPCTVEELQQASSSCFVIAYGEGGYLDGALTSDNRKEIQEKLDVLKQDFPHLDIALSYQQSPLWYKANAVLKQICQSKGISCVALNKTYYLKPEDSYAHKALRCIAEGCSMDDPYSKIVEQKDRYVLSVAEMEKYYGQEELMRTDVIADECVTDYDAIETSLPAFKIQDGIEPGAYLKKLCAVGLKKRLHGNVSEPYVTRLDKELKVILDMHFENYFLIVFDYIRYAKKQGILVGPGRGSAAGSLVAYCLGITEVDPLKYDLLFERFLTKDRITLPDIDTDFPDDKRQEVIQYVADTYGEEHVANIIAFSTLSAKAVVRDVARILKMNEYSLKLFLKHIPNGKVKLSSLKETSASFSKLINSEPQYTKLYNLACALEGLPRNVTQHAAGIVISNKVLEEVVPLIRLHQDIPTVQYEAQYLEDIGLIKMDFLSVRNLSMIASTVDMILKTEPKFSLPLKKLDDPAVYTVFSHGDTNGIFQFESEEMKRLLRKLKPERFEDVVAANALNRPGAISNVDTYIANRAHPSSVQYPCKDLEPYLKDTYGILLYHEQIMRIAQFCASFSPSRADTLRKAISKKDEQQMNTLKKEFLKGCLRHGYSEEVSISLWNDIEKFGSYGFNKSHSVAYSIVSYQMAYLKAHYPMYFYCTLLNAVIGDDIKTMKYLEEAQNKGVELTSVSVMTGYEKYVVTQQNLVLPLSIVKGTGNATALQIVKERQLHGDFKDYIDFVVRMRLYKFKKEIFLQYIYAGAMDCFGETRMTMIENLDEVINYGDLIQVKKDGVLVADESLMSRTRLKKYQENKIEKIKHEKEVLGFYRNNEEFIELKKKWNIHEPALAAIKDNYGMEVHSFARVLSIKEKTSKNNREYCNLFITDGLSEMSVSVWPSEYARIKGRLQEGEYIRFHGKMNDEGYVQIDRIQIVQQEDEEYGKNLNSR